MARNDLGEFDSTVIRVRESEANLKKRTGDTTQSSIGSAAQTVGMEAAVPSVTLPRGGGGIRGIGEKVSVNPVTGAGSTAVPIPVSPGRSGFAPKLSLSYNTGFGSGPFGFGWRLSIPAISRKTDKGLPKYEDELESDVFLLSDAEDLVPIHEDDGSRFVDTTSVPGYTIHRYRPRIEGLFARIERWTHDVDGSVHWRSLSPDNTLTLYGKDSSSRIADPEHPQRVFSWLICESRDDKGNVILYEYKHEDGVGVDLARCHERNRGGRDDPRRTANRYLKRVLYGNRTPLLDERGQRPQFLTDYLVTSTHWMFEVVIDYGEHDSDAPTPFDAGEWPQRQDPFSTYRSSFEVRTSRLAQRFLNYHNFPDEEGVGDACLVRSTDLTYSNEENPASVRNPVYTFLNAVTQCGYIRTDSGYTKRSFPSLEFEYSQPEIQERVQIVDKDNATNLPEGIDDSTYYWLDLFGEGISGVFTEQADRWYYKRNLSPISDQGVSFAPLEQITNRPIASVSAGARLTDLAGDGQLDVVSTIGVSQGIYEHDGREGWDSFRPFAAFLNRDFDDKNLRFIDIDGDGRADVLITSENTLVWHQSLGERGFGPEQTIPQSLNEESGPRLMFADVEESIFLADLSGDGLTDLVRIRNGEICYWPATGRGFGSRIVMDNSPTFDLPDMFEPRRIRFADIDGSGTTDIIYLHRDGVRLYFNQSGNSWSAPQVLSVAPTVEELIHIRPVDLFGNGVTCLCWSSPLPSDTDYSMRFIDLMGGSKPHLLTKIKNNTGGETEVQYVSSTKFYLADKRDGKEWITRLPFPVHVVEQTVSIDHIARTRFVSSYSYHHGHFDGEEREFRGFAMVEQTDSESFFDFAAGVESTDGKQDTDPSAYQPPVTTRTWFHTGAWIRGGRSAEDLVDEYYTQSRLLPERILPDNMTAEEYRESVRALKGLPLRREVYSFDESDEESIPYTVTEYSYEVKLIQKRATQRHAVFLPIGRESIASNFERNPDGPRISHTFTLEVDEYGNTLNSAVAIYGRRVDDNSLPAEVQEAQRKLHITYSESEFTDDIMLTVPTPTYRLRVAYEARSFEVTGISPDGNIFLFDELRDKLVGAEIIPYEQTSDDHTVQQRLLSKTRTVFLDNDLTALPLGQWDTLGLGYRNFTLAFTPSVIEEYYDDAVSDDDLTAAGYVHFDGDSDWWIPSAVAIYPENPADHFYRTIGARDALGVEITATYDQYDLLIERSESPQAPWNVTSVVNDYRLLGPIEVIDPNKNRSAVEVDELGMVVKRAVMGKEGSADGDTLADPTTRMEYELFNWVDNGKPNYVHTLSRERHRDASTRWQESYSYMNGGGGLALVKAQAHPGSALRINDDGEVEEVEADPRWIGNGRTILNNKGAPIKQFEPYYSVTHEYEDEDGLREIGVTPILYYDPLGRNVRVELPNGTHSKVEFDQWKRTGFDANDTVKESDWYVDRGSPDPNVEAEPSGDPERRTAWLTARHSNTPGVIHYDSLGRPVLAVSDFGGGVTSATRSEVDLTGRFTIMFDQLEREVASGFAGMGGNAIVSESAEKGKRWMFQNVLGALVKTWDEYGRKFRVAYDEIQRPIATYVTEKDSDEILINYTVYGDRRDDAEALNLLGVPHLFFDQAGMARVPKLDFKGNPKSVERALASDYQNSIDWSNLLEQPDVASIATAAEPMLELDEIFTASSEYDALNRPTLVTLPDDTVVEPVYNEANFLSSLKAKIRGQGESIEFLKGQDYNAKGQRIYAEYGNDLLSQYFYDPQTFQLTRLLTFNSNGDPDSQALQDLNYNYDPAGNITQVRDEAQQTHYFNNSVVRAEQTFEYDALYQLIRASGREHAGSVNDGIRTETDLAHVPQLPHANDSQALRNYTEEYEYDLLGNLKLMKHRFNPQPEIGDGWTRHYQYAYEDDATDRTNRLSATSLAGDPESGPYSATYSYDDYGNMTKMPHLSDMKWDFMDQLRSVDLGGGGVSYCVYGLGGQRIRKVVERNGNTRLEWLYLGPVLLYRRRRRDTGELRFERWTVTISDNTATIAQVDTKTLDLDNEDPDNALDDPLVRYQFGNHLGSAMLETDENGNPVSYEEYHPYGTSSYRSAKPQYNLSLKRFRFSGKERDDETGLYYFGFRYYAAWLGRWTSSDPAGFVRGPNLYRYCSNSPIVFHDPTGLQESADQKWTDFESSSHAVTGEMDRKTASEQLRKAGWEFHGYTESGTKIEPGSGEFGLAILKDDTWELGYIVSRPGESGSESGDSGPNSSSGASSVDPNAVNENPAGPIVESDALHDENKSDVVNDNQDDSVAKKLAPNPANAAIATRDSFKRKAYESKNKVKSKAAQKLVDHKIINIQPDSALDTAKKASDSRIADRKLMQKKVSPGARSLSEFIDGNESTDDIIDKYSKRQPSEMGGRKIPPSNKGELAKRVAVGVGSSNRGMSFAARWTRRLGPVGTAVGILSSADTIASAPEGQRGRVAAGEAGSIAFGAVGFQLGMIGGTALAAVATSALISLGIISGPIGWLAIGIAGLSGLALGAAFGWGGRHIAEGAYDSL